MCYDQFLLYTVYRIFSAGYCMSLILPFSARVSRGRKSSSQHLAHGFGWKTCSEVVPTDNPVAILSVSPKDLMLVSFAKTRGIPTPIPPSLLPWTSWQPGILRTKCPKAPQIFTSMALWEPFALASSDSSRSGKCGPEPTFLAQQGSFLGCGEMGIDCQLTIFVICALYILWICIMYTIYTQLRSAMNFGKV